MGNSKGKKQDAAPAAEKEEEELHTSIFEACCAGLTPVLEAVDELLVSGANISAPPSAQNRVSQYFIKQLSAAPAAAATSATSLSPRTAQGRFKAVYVRPEGLQDTKQLSELLQRHVKTIWVCVDCEGLAGLVSAVNDLITHAAHQVARQQLIEKNSQAYGVLLDEGYRAGVMAQGCAALKAALGLRIVSHTQLARAMAVCRLAVNRAVREAGTHTIKGSIDSAAAGRLAWQHLQAYHSSSSGRQPPAWASGQREPWLVLAKVLEVTTSCFDLGSLPPWVFLQTVMASPGTLPGSIKLTESGPAAGLAPFVTALFSGGCPCCSGTSKACKSSSSGGGSSSSSTSKPVVQAAASGKAGDSAGGSGTARGSAAAGASSGAQQDGSDAHLPPGLRRPALNMSLPLDECALFAAACVGLAPLLQAIADWVHVGRPRDSSALRAALKAYVASQVNAPSLGSSSVVADAADSSPRRTLMPVAMATDSMLVEDVRTTVTLPVVTVFGRVEAAKPCQGVAELVHSLVLQVAREQVVEKHTAAYRALCQAGCTAGLAVIGCSVLQDGLGITLLTEQQLVEAVRVCSDATRGYHARSSSERTGAVRASTAFNVYQSLQRIAARAAGGSGAGSGGGTAFNMPACGLEEAFGIIDGFHGCLAIMVESEGVLTRDKALATKAAKAKADKEFVGNGAAATDFFTALLDSFAKQQGSSAADAARESQAAAEEAGEWGKGKGLAGLKGLFSQKGAADSKSPPPAAAAAATGAKGAAAAQMSSSGAAVASAATGKQPAPTAATGGAAAKTAAAQPKAAGSSSSNSGVGSGAGAASADSKSSKASSTPPELLVEANLKKWYCSPHTFTRSVVQPLPEDSLKLLVKLKLHTSHKHRGWNALHYACASHRLELVKQLLAAGASVSEHEGNNRLQPLHLACVGRVADADEFDELVACSTWQSFLSFVGRSGPACLELVSYLLNRGADPDAKAGRPDTELFGLTPLHILGCWVATDDEDEFCQDIVFHNPFMGKAIMLAAPHHAKVMACSYAMNDLATAAAGRLGLRTGTGELDLHELDDSTYPEEQVEEEEEELGWGDDLQDSVLHLACAQQLVVYGAQLECRIGVLGDTPLMVAARVGNAAMTEILCRAGADTEAQRYDGARALDIAGHQGYCRVGWTLLCYGQAIPQWMMSGGTRLPDVSCAVPPAFEGLKAEMLVCNAVQCDDPPWNVRFLERLLLEWVGLEDVWEETGETPLLMAIGYKDVEMVRLLVMAGANVNACVTLGQAAPAVAYTLFKTTRGGTETELLQILIDAGADLHSWRSEDTDYDLVQTAANMCLVEAALKLVEAGAKWQLPKGQRVLGGSVFYAPEILTTNIPSLKLSYMEARFKLAEKVGRQRRATLATALQPWLHASTTQECKEATVRTLYAAGVTPSKFTQQRQQRPHRPLASAAAAAARASTQGKAVKGWKVTPPQQQQQQAVALAGQDGLAAAATEEQHIQSLMEQLLLEEAQALAAASAAASSKVANKKKKKATQREARRQQQLRLQRLQQQQEQQSGSGSDGEEEGRRGEAVGVTASADAVTTALADAGAAAAVSAAVGQGEVPASEGHTVQAAQQRQEQDKQVQQDEPTQEQQQSGKKKGKSSKKQQQQQLAKAAAAQPAAPAGAGATAEPAANAPTSPVQQAAASPVKGKAGMAAPAAPAAAAAAVDRATSPQPLDPAARAAFLPPHLRMSMAAAQRPTPGAAGSSSSSAAAAGQPMLGAVPPAAVVVGGVASAAVPQVQAPAATAQQQPQQQASGLQQRMIQLAQQHQMQQQAAPAQQQQQHQQHQQGAQGTAPPLPGMPSAMMAFLSEAAHHKAAAPGRAAAAPAGAAAVAGGHAAARPAGGKRQAPAAAAPSLGPTTVRQQQHPHQQQHQHQHYQQAVQGPAAAAAPAGQGPGRTSPAAAADGGQEGVKGPKLCMACSQARRNVLLMPCNHMVLCEGCADQLHAKGSLASCPHCHKPVKQRIRVHKS